LRGSGNAAASGSDNAVVCGIKPVTDPIGRVWIISVRRIAHTCIGATHPRLPRGVDLLPTTVRIVGRTTLIIRIEISCPMTGVIVM